MKKPLSAKIFHNVLAAVAIIPIWMLAQYSSKQSVNIISTYAEVFAGDVILYTEGPIFIATIGYWIAFYLLFLFILTILFRRYDEDKRKLDGLRKNKNVMYGLVLFFIIALGFGELMSSEKGFIVTPELVARDNVFYTEIIPWGDVEQVSLELPTELGPPISNFFVRTIGSRDPNLIVYTNEGLKIDLWRAPTTFRIINYGVTDIIQLGDSEKVVQLAMIYDIPICVQDGALEDIRNVAANTDYQGYQDVLRAFERAAPVSDCSNDVAVQQIVDNRELPTVTRVFAWIAGILFVLVMISTGAVVSNRYEHSLMAKLLYPWLIAFFIVVLILLTLPV